MRALPIDVVKALIAIIDCRGFTRAAESLGRTQPTISLQIRRLEELVGAPMFESTAQLTLSPRGRTVVEYGRRLVAAHDELSAALQRGDGEIAALRLGVPHELAALLAPGLVALAGRSGGGEALEVTTGGSEALIERVRARRLDLALAMSPLGEAEASLVQWTLPLVWIAAPEVNFDGVVRLVTPPEGTLFHRLAIAALAKGGRAFEIVCKSECAEVLRSAVEAGLGVALAPAFLRSAGPAPSLPPAPAVALHLHGREGVGERLRAALVARIDEQLQRPMSLAAA